ncbi:unnamed protein product [Ilex paraguariensis]|uniref:Uncharacterized protein n=1 Tax=Ilex paraguariensis TaxID=185542 RepID=A0ABC8TS41_9AQUA
MEAGVSVPIVSKADGSVEPEVQMSELASVATSEAPFDLTPTTVSDLPKLPDPSLIRLQKKTFYKKTL